MSIKSRTIWEYRVHCLPALEIEKVLNEAGREGYSVLHLDHKFNGHDETGVTYVVLGRQSEIEQELHLAATHHA